MLNWLMAACLLLLPTGAAWADSWGDECNACPAGARWRDGAAVTFEVPATVLSGSLAYDLRDAMRAWQEGPCVAPSLTAEVVDQTRFKRDGVNAVVFVESAPESGDEASVLAATCNRCDAEGFIVESDIELFGPPERWNDNCLSASFSQRGVLLHELAHTLGLDDRYDDGGRVTYGVVGSAQSHRFGSPAAGDFAELCGLYGVRPDAAIFTPVAEGCVDAFGRAGERCDGEGPSPAGLLCVQFEGASRWAWRCDTWQACEAGATCVPLGAEEDDGGFCRPDAPVVAAALGDLCEQDSACAEGLCAAEAGEVGRCLQECGPSLVCGGTCSDVVREGGYLGRWCRLTAAAKPAVLEGQGCATAAAVGWPAALLFGLLHVARRRRQAIRLATRGHAP
ncbi:MAG: hypothetical protein HQ461_08170 [Deltaproteobacteria bacterium]|nr:hypothetical protein [Deltaproteobacteria bacterium]